MAEHRHLSRNEKIKIIKILKSLNYMYSLRQLESIVGVSYQNLWKYVNMLAIPSDDIAVEIIEKLNDSKIIEKTIADMTKKYRDDIYRIAYDLGFLMLYVQKLDEELKNLNIGMVVPLSEYSIPFATMLSWELGVRFCTPIFGKKVATPKIKVVWYYSQRDSELCLLLLPKLCLEEELDVFLVDIALNDIEKLKSVVQLLKTSEKNISGVASVYITRDCLEFVNRNVTHFVHYISII